MKKVEDDVLEKRLLNMPVIRNKNWVIFSEEYARTLDHQKAYRKAYPNAGPGTYKRGGYKLLQVDEVRDYIDFILLNNLRNTKLGIKPSKILEEIQEMAFSPDHKYPNVKKDALNMLMSLYNGQIMDALDDEIKNQANIVSGRLEEQEEEKKIRKERQEEIERKISEQTKRRIAKKARKALADEKKAKKAKKAKKVDKDNKDNDRE